MHAIHVGCERGTERGGQVMQKENNRVWFDIFFMGDVTGALLANFEQSHSERPITGLIKRKTSLKCILRI